MSDADGAAKDAGHREVTPQPHPDDWPDDISEPEFLELTQVYSGDGESREDVAPDAPGPVDPTPEHPVPGDEMQAYYIADESPDEVVFAPDLMRDEPVHAPQDFIADEPVSGDSPNKHVAHADDTADAYRTASDHSEAVFEDEFADVQPRPAATHATDLADARPKLEDLEQAYPAEKARQGRIVLDKPEKRALFLGGLVGMAIVALAMFLMETV